LDIVNRREKLPYGDHTRTKSEFAAQVQLRLPFLPKPTRKFIEKKYG